MTVVLRFGSSRHCNVSSWRRTDALSSGSVDAFVPIHESVRFTFQLKDASFDIQMDSEALARRLISRDATGVIN